jgi:OCT family organic cation transporter-like MFS transporter 4/5
MVGRKPTFFGAIFITVVFNVAGYFSTCWEMFAAMRFIIGIGIGSYLTVQYSLANEFASAKWRPVVVATPSWPLQGCLFALAAWGLHDWKSIHLAIAIIGAPFLLTWLYVYSSQSYSVFKRLFPASISGSIFQKKIFFDSNNKLRINAC